MVLNRLGMRVLITSLALWTMPIPSASAGSDSGYVVRAAPSALVQVAPPDLPDITPYTADAVRDRLGPTDVPARIGYRRLIEVLELSEFSGGDNRILEWARRQPRNPRIIVVEGGYATPRDLAAALPAEHVVEPEPGVYLLRLPLLIRHGATFHIDASTRDLRLSEERGAFLVNDGRLFITDSALTAWREADDGPARFRRGKDFRPFLLSWGGTETFIVNSRISSLGYAASKSYGVSISQYSPDMVNVMKRPPPKAWIIDSEFIDHWYGFYCYEAEDIVLLRNVYRDNIVYGIDPHDRSERLIIAHNVAYGTRKKHGIIISREVNNSWVFGNRSYDNRLSGIVIDRSSVHNVIANNVSYGNGSDGITVYESPDNLFWANVAMANGRHGIRVRNSLRVRLHNNRSIANGSTGIYGHTKDLSGTGRDLQLDPFDPFVSLEVVGGLLADNHSGPIKVDSPERVVLHDVRLRAARLGGKLKLRGALREHQGEVLELMVRRGVPAVLERREQMAGGMAE